MAPDISGNVTLLDFITISSPDMSLACPFFVS